MSKEPQKFENLDFNNPEILDKILTSSNPLAENLGSSIIKRQEDNDKFQRKLELLKILITYFIASSATIALIISSFLIIINFDSPEGARTWAQIALTSLTTGIVGFLFGKQSSDRN